MQYYEPFLLFAWLRALQSNYHGSEWRNETANQQINIERKGLPMWNPLKVLIARHCGKKIMIRILKQVLLSGFCSSTIWSFSYLTLSSELSVYNMFFIAEGMLFEFTFFMVWL